MNVSIQTVSRCLFLSGIFVFALLFFSACSGGTRGTGGRLVNGTIVRANSEPIVGLNVNIPAAGTTVVTDENGSFMVNLETNDPDIEFLVETDDETISVRIENLSADSDEIDVGFEFDEDERTLTPIFVDERDNDAEEEAEEAEEVEEEDDGDEDEIEEEDDEGDPDDEDGEEDDEPETEDDGDFDDEDDDEDEN